MEICSIKSVKKSDLVDLVMFKNEINKLQIVIPDKKLEFNIPEKIEKDEHII